MDRKEPRPSAEAASAPESQVAMGAPRASGLEREVAELRREILESRNLVIKSDNLLRGLHAEVKALGKRHEDAEKRSWIASGVAYGAFALLAALGAGAAARGFVASTEQETVQARAQAAQAQDDAKKARAQLDATQTASRAAEKAYARMQASEPQARLQAATAVASLDRSRLTPLEAHALDDRARLVREELAAAALERGRAAFHRNDLKDTAVELERYFQVADPATADVLASFDDGVALWQERQYAGAAKQLGRFLELGKGLKNRDYAQLLLGESLEALGRKADAQAAYHRGLDEHPASEFAPQYRHRLARLDHANADAPQAAAGAPPAKL